MPGADGWTLNKLVAKARELFAAGFTEDEVRRKLVQLCPDLDFLAEEAIFRVSYERSRQRWTSEEVWRLQAVSPWLYDRRLVLAALAKAFGRPGRACRKAATRHVPGHCPRCRRDWDVVTGYTEGAPEDGYGAVVWLAKCRHCGYEREYRFVWRETGELQSPAGELKMSHDQPAKGK